MCVPGSIPESSDDAGYGRVVGLIGSSGVGQFAGDADGVEFFLQQKAKICGVCGIFCDFAFGRWGIVEEVNRRIVARDKVER